MRNLKASYTPYTFHFNFPGGTSRGILTQKQSWFIHLWDENKPTLRGIGEVSILPNLSPESPETIVKKLNEIVKNPNLFIDHFDTQFVNLPALKFGFETALLDLNQGGQQIIFPSDFTQGTKGIKINGLIWMGDKAIMLKRIKEKLEQGFTCLKLKVGAINFDEELYLLKNIRHSFSPQVLEIRVDANGAFDANKALDKLNALSAYKIHSIEQPIRQGQHNEMASLCLNTPIPIALDEELIGIETATMQAELLETIKPHYIILKPSLLGGLNATKNWINLAESKNIKWWVTSALESNIGLNAIAQWTYKLGSKLPQGLGTGQVFSNNIDSPLYLNGEELRYDPKKTFKI